MIPIRYRSLLWEILFIMIWPSTEDGLPWPLTNNPDYNIHTTSKPSTRSRVLQKQNFIGSIYIFIGMLGHRLLTSSWNVSDFEFSDVYFIIWFYMCPIWLHITIGKTLRSRTSRVLFGNGTHTWTNNIHMFLLALLFFAYTYI